MYRVVRFFRDLEDNRHPYEVGDVYPRDGAKATAKRIKELLGSKNKLGKPLIHEFTGTGVIPCDTECIELPPDSDVVSTADEEQVDDIPKKTSTRKKAVKDTAE